MFKRILAAGFALAALGSGSALAATVTTNMQVSVSITAGCAISATNIAFGSLSASTVLTAAQTSTAAMGGLVSYTCTTGSGSTPGLTTSLGANASGAQARMKGVGGTFLNYSLNMPAIGAVTGSAQTAQVTATIPLQATAPAIDSYTDTVTLTLTY